jgi:hypothetical protein
MMGHDLARYPREARRDGISYRLPGRSPLGRRRDPMQDHRKGPANGHAFAATSLFESR